jgi:glycerol uptake facilitator-like aquaporin
MATTKKAGSAESAPAAAPRISKQFVLGALIAELLGSALITFAALMSGNNPILGAVAVLVGIMIFAEVSGAQLNPVVTIAALVTRQVGWVKALSYIVVQVLGAMLAYVIIVKFMGDSKVFTLFTPENQVQAMQQYGQEAHTPGQWKPVFGELIGSLIFGFGIASALLYKKVGFDRAFTVAGALMIGLFAALAGSYAVLNPAVSAAVGAYSQGGFWSFAAYGLAPLVGGALGALLFAFLKKDALAAEAK